MYFAHCSASCHGLCRWEVGRVSDEDPAFLFDRLLFRQVAKEGVRRDTCSGLNKRAEPVYASRLSSGRRPRRSRAVPAGVVEVRRTAPGRRPGLVECDVVKYAASTAMASGALAKEAK
jgi:hypothetical protein